jgi:hypothetical protein
MRKIAGSGSLVRGRDPRIRIRIQAKMSWIRNTGFYVHIRINLIPIRVHFRTYTLQKNPLAVQKKNIKLLKT